MKNLKLVVFILFVAAFFSSPASSSIMVKGALQKILLQGKLSNPQGRSLSPIEVFQHASHLQVDFLISLGSLNIVVVGDAGNTVFQTTFNATANSSLSINTNGWKDGEYSIHICNGSNECAEGKFAIVADED